MPNDVATPNIALVIQNVTYDVVEGPAGASALVREARSEVMQNLNLDRILSDLDRTNELLYIASCGVAGAPGKDGKDLSARVAHLQHGLLNAAQKGIVVMLSFKEAAQGVLTALQRAFRELYRLREDRTLIVLARCEEYAKSMADNAGELATEFKTLANEAEGTLETTLTVQNQNEQDRIAALKRRDEIKALDAKAKALKKELADSMEKVQKLYDEAKAAQEKAEDRAFGLAIMNGICGAISSGVAAFAAVKTAPVTAATSVVDAVVKGNTKTDTKPDTKATSTGTTKSDTKTGAGDPTKGDTKTSGKSAAAETGKGDTKKVDAGASSGTAAKGDAKKAAGSSGDETSDTGNTSAAAAAAIKAAANSAGDSAQQASGSYEEIARRYSEERKKYLDLLMDLQKEQRAALGAIAEYAETMKIAEGDAALAKSAVESLQQAVAALKQIVTSLETAKLFWEMMAAACRRLANSKLAEDIKLYMKDPPEDRLAEWTDDSFKVVLLRLAARWFALKLIAEEYHTAVGKISETVAATINKAPTIEEARVLAPKLGAKLALEVEKDMRALDEDKAKLEAEKKQLQLSAA